MTEMRTSARMYADPAPASQAPLTSQDRRPEPKDKAATRAQMHAAPGRHARIATRAYFLSELRGDRDGCPLGDWLEAERQDDGDRHSMLRFPDMDHRG